MSLPDMMEWAKEHPDRAAIRIAELERENKQLRQTVLETLSQRGQRELIVAWDRVRELERENAKLREKFMFAESEIILLREDRDELRQAKDAYFKHNNILVELMTEEQRKKALEISISQPKEPQS